MDRVEESKVRTPAYASFDSNTDKLSHLLTFILHGVQGFSHEWETKIQPEVEKLCTEIVTLRSTQHKKASDQVPEKGAQYAEQDLSDAKRIAEIANRVQGISDAVAPLRPFTDGLLTVREWIPVLLVTIVEGYLKDVLLYAASVDPGIMESSEQPPPSRLIWGGDEGRVI